MEDARIGEVTVIRRSDRALRLNVHLHTLALDGVYVREGMDTTWVHIHGETPRG